MKSLLIYCTYLFITSPSFDASAEVDLKLSAQVTGKPSGTIIFIHGTPGSADSYAKLLIDQTLRRKALMVAINRPGYGQSEESKKALSIEDQARLFSKYIETNYPGRKIILVGHSYGSAIAAKMASEKNAHYQAVFLLSAIADPSEIKKDWAVKGSKMVSGIAKLPLTQAILSPSMLTCQRDLESFDDNLESLANDWQEIKAKMIVVRGEKDPRVSLKHGDYIKSAAKNSKVKVITIENAGHHLLEEDALAIKNLLLQEL